MPQMSNHRTRSLTLLGGCAAALLGLAAPALAQKLEPGNDPAVDPDPVVLPLPEGPIGILDLQRDAKQIEELRANRDIVHPGPTQIGLQPLFRHLRAAHVANGVALRNRVRGTIHLRGVPLGSQILQSLLFWNFSDGVAAGAPTMDVLIEGNLVKGRLTANNSDPCWGNVANHSYVADVTRFTNQAGGPNQEYEVSLPYPGPVSSTSGQNPWGPFEFQDPRLSGATLVVIYSDDASGPLAVYAPAGDNMFFNTAIYNFASPGAGPALFTMMGADGQRGFGHSVFASGERTFFPNAAGPLIAGLSTVTSSDWDGSDGWPLTQLWDTHTHLVRATFPASTVRYSAPPGAAAFDCLVPVAFVLDLL
jgi:hypothetical protein